MENMLGKVKWLPGGELHFDIPPGHEGEYLVADMSRKEVVAFGYTPIEALKKANMKGCENPHIHSVPSKFEAYRISA